ncbi:BRO-N domain-containing protein [Mucilaginibacter pedocola]|uniref:Antirepressor n=1 Tax=Mucilaginibacter pedocola TaxID=1792845 RepID=A0A1S9PID5_9SPHI|nr:Bro-N domain-containing protein [Mucilaginibacter pedocola]OOQ60328.1 antirepressor [Mucilaginibacter pedocola]
MQLSVFKFEDNEQVNDFTTIEIDGEPWFRAKDVCDLLEITNGPREIASLDDDEKLLYEIRIAGQMRKVNFVNESGLYRLVFKSKKSNAAKFRKWITKEVIPTIRKTGGFGKNQAAIPNFVVRFNDNWDRTDRGYFSVISELFIRLYGRFEQVGYQIPNKAFDGKEIRPDVSVGKRFASFLKDKHPDLEDHFKMYKHKFPNGLEFDARQYKNDYLPLFIKFVDEDWMPNCARQYFLERDRKAIDYLPHILSGGKEPLPVASAEPKLSNFNKSLKQALNYNPKKGE